MKRSRRSEYDKKRNRSSKKSERNISYSKSNVSNKESASVSNSASNSNSIDRLKSFEVDENQEKKYSNRTVTYKKRSGCFNLQLPLGVMILFFIFKIIMAIDSTSRAGKTAADDPIMQKVAKDAKMRIKKGIQRNPAFLMQGFIWPMITSKILEKDSVIAITSNINLTLRPSIRMYRTAQFKTTALMAKLTKSYIIHDQVQKSTQQSLTEQWFALRDKLSSRISKKGVFTYENKKSYTYKEYTIEEKEFTIETEEVRLIGVATLIETKNKRHFLQYFTKTSRISPPDFTSIKKNLDHFLTLD